MIRRNVVAGGGGVAGPNSPDSGGQQRSTAAASASGSRSGALSSSSHLHSRPRQQRSLTDIAVAFLLMASAVLTILSFMFPAAQQAVVREVEHEGVVVQEMLQNAEDELMQKYWHAHHEAVHAAIPPKTIEQQQLERQQQEKNGPHHEDAYDAEQAALSDRRMQQQTDGSWVAGEKKLKQKLKLLADRQAQGLDLGVPVLTRWATTFPRGHPWTNQIQCQQTNGRNASMKNMRKCDWTKRRGDCAWPN
jgi:hypothetical protein